jgi:histidinol dehydrogenase
MIRIIERTDRAALDGFVSHLRERSVVFDSALLSNVSSIIEDVRRRGDEALVEYAARFDKVVLDISELRVSTRHFGRLLKGKLRSAVSIATGNRNVRTFHERQCEQSWSLTQKNGVQIGQRITPIESVGLYVPVELRHIHRRL